MGAVVVCPHGLSAAAVRFGSVRLGLVLVLGVPLRVAPVRYALGLRSAPIHPLRVWIPLHEACGLRSERHYVPLRSLRPVVANPSRAFLPSIVPTASMPGGFHFKGFALGGYCVPPSSFGSSGSKSRRPRRASLVERRFVGYSNMLKREQLGLIGRESAKGMPTPPHGGYIAPFCFCVCVVSLEGSFLSCPR